MPVRNDSTVKSGTISRWIALETQHENNKIKALEEWFFPCSLTNKGPAKSKPTLKNAGATSVLKLGKSDTGDKA